MTWRDISESLWRTHIVLIYILLTIIIRCIITHNTRTTTGKTELMFAPACCKELLLNQAELTFHELHKAKLTSFDFFKQLTDMHDDQCGSMEFAYQKYHHQNGNDDPWVWQNTEWCSRRLVEFEIEFLCWLDWERFVDRKICYDFPMIGCAEIWIAVRLPATFSDETFICHDFCLGISNRHPTSILQPKHDDNIIHEGVERRWFESFEWRVHVR